MPRSRPITKHSGAGENTACQRPGRSSPTIPIVAAAAAGRTTWTGSVGLGLKTEANSMPDRNAPAAPSGSTP